MQVHDLEKLLEAHPFVQGMHYDHVRTLLGCCANRHFETGDYLFRGGSESNEFFLIREGNVSLELHVPGHGALRLDTRTGGDLLGWSWLMKPYRWHFDARSLTPVAVLSIEEGGRRVGLGRKQLEPDPWDGLALRLGEDSLHVGRVTRVTDFGAFVELAPGVEGLLHVSQLGPERVRGAYAWRSLRETGVLIPAGSDAPVEAISPLAGIYAAVTRRGAAGSPAAGWSPEQRLTRSEALRAFTSWAAFAGFADTWCGTLEAGKRADLVVLDRDLLRCPEDDIAATRVLATLVDGREALAPAPARAAAAAPTR